LDSAGIKNLGWEPEVKLADGISSTYDWFLKNYSEEISK
jgi:nucleoside-diphosphate-sugar epimerase